MAYQFSPERAQELAAEAVYRRINDYLGSGRSAAVHDLAASLLLTPSEVKAGLEYGIAQGRIRVRMLTASGRDGTLSFLAYSKVDDLTLLAREIGRCIGNVRKRFKPSES